MKNEDDDEKVKYSALDISTKFDCLAFEDVPISLPNFGLVNLRPMKFIIKNDQSETLFDLESSMLQLKNFDEQRCDRACSMTFLRPKYLIKDKLSQSTLGSYTVNANCLLN